jgi:nucleotide-binding universal stress UspA family protein
MKKVLVAIDGSEQSIRAAKMAAQLVKPDGGRLTLAYVVVPYPLANADLPIGVEEMNDSLETYGTKVLQQTRALLESSESPIDTRVLFGGAADAIDALARQDHYELIAVGSRGGGAIARLLLGSVTDRLLRISRTPILVVH